MASFNCNREIRKYHSNEVVLSKAQQDEMRDRRDNGRIRLENGLIAADHALPYLVSSQGSYAMRTMVQDDENDYDIDDGVYFAYEDLLDEDGNELEPKAARRLVKKALHDARLAFDAQVKNNCVRQYYPAGYHIDLPVYRTTWSEDYFGNETITHELASGDEWVVSDARAVTKWFNGHVTQELKSGDVDTSQLRKVVRLTKKLARSRKAWKNKTTSGICITKLVVDHMVYVTDRDDEALRSTWQAIKNVLAFSRTVKHPVQPINLAEWDDERVGFFEACLLDSLKHLDVLDKSDCSQEEAMKAWNKVFDTDYFSDFIPTNKAAASLLQPAAVVSSGLSFPNKPIVPNKSSGFA
ncbi:cyclic GMP-AMP synthase DncV-like nucleotidyltransferase [Methylophilus luteus]|uniref:Cyclic GMP-AMP synthase n=1 Tax=Methylophilus luteus TaxID=640108 RepID=A0ABW3F4F4_9PROT